MPAVLAQVAESTPQRLKLCALAPLILVCLNLVLKTFAQRVLQDVVAVPSFLAVLAAATLPDIILLAIFLVSLPVHATTADWWWRQ